MHCMSSNFHFNNFVKKQKKSILDTGRYTWVKGCGLRESD